MSIKASIGCVENGWFPAQQPEECRKKESVVGGPISTLKNEPVMGNELVDE
jgi:hypothetical protein